MAKYLITIEIDSDHISSEAMDDLVDAMTVQLESLTDGSLSSTENHSYPCTLTKADWTKE